MGVYITPHNAITRLFLGPQVLNLIPVPIKSNPLTFRLSFWVTSEMSMGKRPKWLQKCRHQAHLTMMPVVLYCVSMGTVVQIDPTTEGCWVLPQGCICGSFPPVVHLEGECFRDDKEQENKNSHKGKEKSPCWDASHT